jgi:nucleotide-binding universal stress UspA family protein
MAALRAAGRNARDAIRAGMAKVELVEAVREVDADLLVVGARGLGGFEELLVGSVSHAVSKTAPCSVAVVHRRDGGPRREEAHDG